MGLRHWFDSSSLTHARFIQRSKTLPPCGRIGYRVQRNSGAPIQRLQGESASSLRCIAPRWIPPQCTLLHQGPAVGSALMARAYITQAFPVGRGRNLTLHEARPGACRGLGTSVPFKRVQFSLLFLGTSQRATV